MNGCKSEYLWDKVKPSLPPVWVCVELGGVLLLESIKLRRSLQRADCCVHGKSMEKFLVPSVRYVYVELLVIWMKNCLTLDVVCVIVRNILRNA